MGLFSFFRKNKQESASGQGEFLSRAAGESAAIRSRNSNSRGKPAKAGKDKDEHDPVLPEKKRARRRLIGAVALVLAVIIVLPMILDSEPRPLAGDIAIQIPSKDGKDSGAGNAASATADSKAAVAEPKEEIVDPSTLAPANDNPAIAPGAPAMPSGPANAPAQQAAPAAALMPAPVEKPEVPKPAAKAEVKTEVKESKPVEHKEERKKEVARAPEKAAEKAPEKPSGKDGDSARAMAILEGKPTAADKKSGAAGGKFVIQVAALATQEKIDELRNKLSGAGIKSFTQKVATKAGDRTRIRVGPFASRDEADKTRAKINKLGLNATIVPT